ncbi:hypothetical protein C8P63_12513 [Melghirimyces profundicolus]|uniref:Uncharacterized protein n=1 Tax=Melghirimyces profundicolus TaxID=1242148 RepID=A0A2T6BCU3_9BACL|nr:hypothetical protein [Melghirimyces profundicolus]PTX53895.1 hypothetical protein C8P63_12513 [Melghirimyces profundicolus]
MRSTGKMRGRFYEHYQVEDVLTFFSGQLISAKSPDGMQVLLQEIALKDSLPPGSKEMLTNLENEHLAPVLDVIEEQDRIVLVHPPLTGEPLSLMIRPRQGMEPAQALSVFRRLLRTAVRLSKLPIPLFTTLDPRNIIMEGTRPFVLFVSFEKFSKRQADEKWRFLLHFLLTGFQLDRRPENPESDRSIRELPKSMKELVLLSMSPEQSMENVLEAAEKTVPPKSKKRPVKKKRSAAGRLVYPAAVVAVLLLGAVAAKELFLDNRDAAAEMELEAENRLQREGKDTYSDILFQREKPITQSLPPSLNGSFRVFGELTQKNGKPFTLSLVSENVESDFGVRVDKDGKIHLFQYINGETYDLMKTGNDFKVKPHRHYRMEIYYFPGQPFRVSVTEKESSKKWVAVGQVPMDSDFKVELKGEEGTRFGSPGVAKIERNGDSLNKWMDWQPWELVSGNGVLYRNTFTVGPDARVTVNSKKPSFVFKRKEDFKEDPLRMEMESVNGERYLFDWLRNGTMELSRVGYESEKLGTRFLGEKYHPATESRVSINSNSQGFFVNVKHDQAVQEIRTTSTTPITIRTFTIITKSEIILMNK